MFIFFFFQSFFFKKCHILFFNIYLYIYFFLKIFFQFLDLWLSNLRFSIRFSDFFQIYYFFVISGFSIFFHRLVQNIMILVADKLMIFIILRQNERHVDKRHTHTYNKKRFNDPLPQPIYEISRFVHDFHRFSPSACNKFEAFFTSFLAFCF